MSGICEGSGASFFSSGQIVLASSGQLRAQITENIRYSCGPKLLGIYGRLLYVQCCWQCLVYVKAQVLPFSRVARLSWHHQASCGPKLLRIYGTAAGPNYWEFTVGYYMFSAAGSVWYM